MYIEKLAYKNVGPLQDVRIDFPFNNNGKRHRKVNYPVKYR